MAYVPTIDANACAAHGDCVEIVPEVFELEGDVATVIGTGPDDLILEAAKACPSVAIVVTNDDGEQVFP